MALSPLRILALSTILLASFAAPAGAATPAQIHRDAADGSIDGSYTLAQMRAADREVSAEQREYFGWDDAYRDYVRQLAAPAPRLARDSMPSSSASLGGPRYRTIDSSDKSPGRSDRLGAADSAGARTGAPGGFADDDRADADARITAAAPAESSPQRVGRSSSADSGVPLAWSLAAIPLAILAAGAWRVRRVRRRAAAERAAAWW